MDNDPLTHDVVAKAIKTEGAVGWLIHRAIKSNYAKHRAALIAAENDAAKSVPGAGGDVGTGQVEPRVEAPVEGNVSKTVMWDPVRDV